MFRPHAEDNLISYFEGNASRKLRKSNREESSICKDDLIIYGALVDESV